MVLVNRCIVGDDRNRLLLIQRAETDENNPLQWEFPGGKLDEGQDLTHALEREVLEETGLLVEPSSHWVYADSFVLSRGKYAGLPYVVLFGIGRAIGGKLKLSGEHQASAWEYYDSALDYELTAESRKALIIFGRSIVNAATASPEIS